jgi:hypothetical protein
VIGNREAELVRPLQVPAAKAGLSATATLWPRVGESISREAESQAIRILFTHIPRCRVETVRFQKRKKALTFLVWLRRTVSHAQGIIFRSKQASKGQNQMKKQVNPSIKAHLLKSSSIVLVLLAVCVIPFALAQQTYRGKPDERYGSRAPSRVVNPSSLGETPMTSSCRIMINEGFDDIENLPGWVLINHSQPLGGSDWFQGNENEFPAFDGPLDAYIAANFNNGGGLATISNWLLTPEIGLQNGSTLTFYTRTVQASTSLTAMGIPSGVCNTGPFPDRLQVRMSINGASTDVGMTAFDVGDFNNLLLDINPTYAIGGYPESWTQFTIIISGVPSGTSGRLAFRYFVEDGGPEGTRSSYIGIDRAVYCAVLVRVLPTPRPQPTPAPRP